MDNAELIARAGRYIKHRMPELSDGQARDAAMHAFSEIDAAEECIVSKAPEAEPCPHCDLGSGHRGVDTCAKCGGTGSQFVVGNERFKNTERGYNSACAATTAAYKDG